MSLSVSGSWAPFIMFATTESAATCSLSVRRIRSCKNTRPVVAIAENIQNFNILLGRPNVGKTIHAIAKITRDITIPVYRGFLETVRVKLFINIQSVDSLTAEPMLNGIICICALRGFTRGSKKILSLLFAARGIISRSQRPYQSHHHPQRFLVVHFQHLKKNFLSLQRSQAGI